MRPISASAAIRKGSAPEPAAEGRVYEVVAFQPRPRQFAVLFRDQTVQRQLEEEQRKADRLDPGFRD